MGHTAYTPYQPEMTRAVRSPAQFPTGFIRFNRHGVGVCSLLDEATAAAEAMALAKRVTKNKSNAYFIADDVHPQTIDVVRTRADMFGFEIIVGKAADAVNHDVFGALIQYPSTTGEVRNDAELIADLKAKKAIVAVVTDPMALLLLKSPGELGADVVVGCSPAFWCANGFWWPTLSVFRHP